MALFCIKGLICRDSSTVVEMPKAQMNVTKVLTKDYENKSNWTLGENEPKTNPIKANLLNAQMNVTSIITKHYENVSNWTLAENKANSNPIQTQSNPIFQGG